MRRPRRRGATPATCKIAGHQPALLLWAMARPSLAISLSPPPGVEARPDTPEPETALPLCGSWPVCVGRREGAVRRRNPLSHIDFRYSACLSKRLDSGNFLFPVGLADGASLPGDGRPLALFRRGNARRSAFTRQGSSPAGMTSRRVNNRLRLSAVERRGTGGLLRRRCAPQGSGRDAVPWTNSRRVWGNRLPRQKAGRRPEGRRPVDKKARSVSGP